MENFQEPNQEKSRQSLKTLLVVLGAVVIIGSVWLYWLSKYPPGEQNLQEAQTAQEETKSDITVNQVQADKAPEKFPADMPIEEGAKILQNYNASAPDGRFQATRVFESAKTLNQNLTIYENYFKKGGWTITNTIKDQPNMRYISAAKEKVRAQATIRESTTTKVVTVDVSVTYLP